MLLIKETFCKHEFVLFYIYHDLEPLNMENWKAKNVQEVNSFMSDLSTLYWPQQKKKKELYRNTYIKCKSSSEMSWQNRKKQLLQLSGQWLSHFLQVLDRSCLLMITWSLSFSSSAPADDWKKTQNFIWQERCQHFANDKFSYGQWRVEQWRRDLVKLPASSARFGCGKRLIISCRRTSRWRQSTNWL